MMRKPPITDAELALSAAVNGLRALLDAIDPLDHADEEIDLARVIGQESLRMATAVRDAMKAAREGAAIAWPEESSADANRRAG